MNFLKRRSVLNKYLKGGAGSGENEGHPFRGNQHTSRGSKNKTVDITSAKKASNAIDKVTGKKSAPSVGQTGVYRARRISNEKLKPVQDKLSDMGFEQYDEPFAKEGVLTYINKNNITVFIYPGTDNSFDLSFSKTERRLPYIPMD